MNRTLEKNKSSKSSRPAVKKSFRSKLCRVNSLDEIPDFDDPVADRKYWRKHILSKEAIDQVPDIEEDEG